MKTRYFIRILIFHSIIFSGLYSQDITNTLGTFGIFKIKDATNDYMTISQSSGQVNIIRTIRLENTINSSSGVIYKGTDRFLHNYGTNNTFLGVKSGNFSITGQGNSAFGVNTLYDNTGGNNNCAFGHSSLTFNTTGSFNSAFGTNSLNSNNIGQGNSSFGTQSLYSNTTGNNNSALGFLSLSNNTTGSNNIAIGYNAQVPSGTANNQVRMGNTSITYAGIQVAWTVTSDKRLKDNIRSSELGLQFISKLRPVSYVRKNDESKKNEYGLIAQEVEQVLDEEGIENTGMLTVTENGEYQLRYNDFIAPMIKAMQELNEKIDKLTEENAALKERLAKYEQSQEILAKKNSKENK